MPPLRISMAAQNVDAYRDLARKLKTQARADLRKKLRQKVLEAGKPVVDEVKTAILDMPITSHGGGRTQRRRYAMDRATTERAKASAGKRDHGLRRRVAGAVKIQQTVKGVKIIVASNQLPPDQRTLPRHLDSAKGWRHPVFGNKHKWVTQKGRPYFASTIQKRAPAFRGAVLAAMDEVTKELEG